MEIMKVSPPPPHPELISILQILSAANHRNKNQHRLSKWWKSFSQLRRQVAKLITELETFDQIEGMYGEGKKQTLASREVVERRVEFLVDVLGPKCYLAFSNLVADNQYAVLGLMLLGSLARIQKIVEPYRKEKDDKGEDQGVISDELLGNVDLDLGEVIERVEDMDPTEQRDEATHDEDGVEIKKSEKTKRKKRTAALASKKEPLNRAVVESTPSKQPKKKRKKGDFIDDLFDSIV